MKIKWRRILRFKKKKKDLAVAPLADEGNNESSENTIKVRGGPKKKPSLTIKTWAGNLQEDDGMPRISMDLTTKELQEEAMARGIERQFLPKSKEALLEFLVDGSIYLKKTKAWRDVERLKGEMAADCRRIEEEKHFRGESLFHSREEEEEEEERQPREEKSTASSSRVEAPSSQRQENQSKLSSTMGEDEQNACATSTTTSACDNKTQPPACQCDGTASMSRSSEDDEEENDTFPSGSAKESRGGDVNDEDLSSTGGMWNRQVSTMDLSPVQSPMASRYKGHSFKLANRSISFQSAVSHDGVMGNFMKLMPLCSTTVCRTALLSDSEKNDFDKEQELHEVLQRRNQENEARTQEQMEYQEKWDAFTQFEAWIVNPPEKNKLMKGSMMKGFTVWCSISSVLMRHPPKHFDATYKNLNDANARARYLFYWRNPWRLPASKMVEVVLIKSDNSAMSGCASTFHCVHPNGDKWIVSVVNDSTFRYLDNAVMERHDLDKDRHVSRNVFLS